MDEIMPENLIPILAKTGDPLEQEICRTHTESLRSILQPYSEVWFNHIFVRRIGDGSKVVQEWMNFAGSHYTAILRTYHAYESYQWLAQNDIKELKKEDEGKFLLDFHQHWASFWEHIGSSIDNLCECLTVSVPAIVKKELINSFREKYPELEYAYDRRSQFIHSRIVPAHVKDGTVQCKIRTSDHRNRELEPKRIIWNLPFDQDLEVGDILRKEWDNYMKGMTDTWNYLLSELRARDEGRLTAMSLKFPGLSSADAQQLILNGAPEQTLISNSTLPKQKPKVNTIEIQPFTFQSPPPSGTG